MRWEFLSRKHKLAVASNRGADIMIAILDDPKWQDDTIMVGTLYNLIT